MIEKQYDIKYYVVNGLDLYCSSDFVAFHYIPNENGKWEKCDYTRCISDYLYGFDESEPIGSPYLKKNIKRNIMSMTKSMLKLSIK